MSDRRLEILEQHFPTPDHEDTAHILNAMDEYMKECCLGLLQYMADKNIKLSFASNPQEPLFMCGGVILTKEEVFENFL